MFRRDSWLVRRWGAVVGTTKYSEQNHNPKEKGFKLKEYSRLKGHELLSEFDSKTGITFVLALRPIGAVAWGSPLQLATTTFTSVLSVLQVRMAGPGCLTDGYPNVHPTNLDH